MEPVETKAPPIAPPFCDDCAERRLMDEHNDRCDDERRAYRAGMRAVALVCVGVAMALYCFQYARAALRGVLEISRRYR